MGPAWIKPAIATKAGKKPRPHAKTGKLVDSSTRYPQAIGASPQQ
jgi:hypothetical protein